MAHNSFGHCHRDNSLCQRIELMEVYIIIYVYAVQWTTGDSPLAI